MYRVYTDEKSEKVNAKYVQNIDGAYVFYNKLEEPIIEPEAIYEIQNVKKIIKIKEN